MTEPRDTRKRLFYALWPDAPVRDALHDLARECGEVCGGRVTARDNLHVTLAFLGPTTPAEYEAFLALGAALRGETFELALDTVGHWRHNRIVWAGASTLPPALRALAATLTQRLFDLRWRIDERPYTPHVTLVRDARRAPAARDVLLPPWRVRGFALVESVSTPGGVRYTPRAHWPLRHSG